MKLKPAVGKPLVVTLNESVDWPIAKVAVAALVKASGWSTVSVKFWVAFVPTPLLAVNFRL